MMMMMMILVFPRKRLSCSESSFIESESSPPSGTRRRFSALIDTQRLASPLELDSELHVPFKQPPVKARGASLEGAIGSGPSQGDLRSFLTATGNSGEDVFYDCIIHQFTNFEFATAAILFSRQAPETSRHTVPPAEQSHCPGPTGSTGAPRGCH